MNTVFLADKRGVYQCVTVKLPHVYKGYYPKKITTFFQLHQKDFSKPAWPHFWSLVLAIAMAGESTLKRLRGIPRFIDVPRISDERHA